MVQRRRPPRECGQVVKRLEHRGAPLVMPRMGRDDPTTGNGHNAIHVTLDRHRLEGIGLRNAVSVPVENDELVLVHGHRGMLDAGVEGPFGKSSGHGEFLGEPVPNPERSGHRLHGPCLLGQAEPAENTVQLVEVGDPGDRGGEAALDRLDRALGVGFLVAVGRQAIAGIEGVVARQRGVARMGFAQAPREDELGDGLGVVPPDLPGNGGEEVEGGHHAGQDGFGAFGGQREDEGVVGVGPDGDEEGDLTSALGEVDLNVSEIGFEPMSRRMGQGDEGFTAPLAMRSDVASDLAVAASVSVFIAQAAKHLLGGVPLLGRGFRSSAKIWSMTGWRGPKTGAGRSLV